MVSQPGLEELVAEATSMSVDDLYAGIGEWALTTVRGPHPDARERKILAGRAWWEANKGSLRSLICSHSQILALKQTSDSPPLVLASALMDVLGPHYGFPQVASITRLILGVGLASICPDPIA